MKHLKIELQHSSETVHPMHEFVAERESFSLTLLLHWNSGGEGVNTMIFYVEGDAERYAEGLSETPTIEEYSITHATDDSFYVYVRERTDEVTETIIDAVSRAGMVVLSPVEYREDRTTKLSMVGTAEALQTALDMIPDSISVAVTHVGQYDAGQLYLGGTLTDRQREAAEAAVEVGYYDTPRDATVADVAERLGCAPGTAAEHLRKVESKVITKLTQESRYVSS